MSVLIALIIFGFIIVIHEWGHFIIAKKSGICVEEFSVGMGYKIISKTFGGTEYSLRIFPLGGFCRMKGESEGNDPDCFTNAHILKRIPVIFAGPFMNFLLAFAVFTVIFMFFTGVSVPIISEVTENSYAYDSGISIGDKIIQINSKKIRTYQDLSLALSDYEEGEINVRVKRNGETLNFSFLPTVIEGNTRIGIKTTYKAPLLSESGEYEKINIADALYNGYYQTFWVIETTIDGLKMLITKSIGLDNLGGPVAVTGEISNIYKESVKKGLKEVVTDMLFITALLSANIGFMNLLPIPALDGGRLVFLIIELISGKRVNQEKEAFVHFIGFVLVMLFGIVIMINDISKLLR